MDTIIGTDIAEAARFLQEGKCVAIPTETVYGLAANALDPAAVAQIFSIKNRPTFNPLIVHVRSFAEFEKYATGISPLVKKLADAFTPGPLTFVLPKKDTVPDLVTAGGETVALRIPSHPLTLRLLESLPFPLAAPSANPFGYISPVTAQHVEQQLGDKIPYILDGGPCSVGVESTVITFENDKVVVLRLGGVTVEAIEELAGKTELRTGHSSSLHPIAIGSPGQMKSHYAPKHKLLLGDIEKHAAEHAGKNIGILSFRKKYPDAAYQVQLSESGNTDEAARYLFSALRFLDACDIDLILAERLPETGLGRAVNDRLERAAAE
ncbi:MAG: tRNA threonylcarbamoyladenosine biosynthesis protein [Bacteroidetes bacterium]|nr:MAG: tRNA threonylcarbamoyladenosine biosynthesis protein [Bacteroidota bacterium]